MKLYISEQDAVLPNKQYCFQNLINKLIFILDIKNSRIIYDISRIVFPYNDKSIDIYNYKDYLI